MKFDDSRVGLWMKKGRGNFPAASQVFLQKVLVCGRFVAHSKGAFPSVVGRVCDRQGSTRHSGFDSLLLPIFVRPGNGKNAGEFTKQYGKCLTIHRK